MQIAEYVDATEEFRAEGGRMVRGDGREGGETTEDGVTDVRAATTDALRMNLRRTVMGKLLGAMGMEARVGMRSVHQFAALSLQQ